MGKGTGEAGDPFPHVMAYVTRWARTEERRTAVMAALWDIVRKAGRPTGSGRA